MEFLPGGTCCGRLCIVIAASVLATGLMDGETSIDWLGIVGILLTLIGLYLTYRQAKQARSSADGAKTAADAAASAIADTEEMLRQRQSLRLVPTLWSVHNELERAVGRGDTDAVIAGLRNWCQQAGEMKGLIEDDWAESDNITQALSQSVGQAATASLALIDNRERPLPEASKRARTAISRACNALSEFQGKNTLRATKDEVGEDE